MQIKPNKSLLGKLIIGSLCALVLTACSNPAANKSSQTTNAAAVTIGYTQFPANLDPADDYNGWFTIRYGLAETLFKLENDYTVKPWLAEKIEPLSDLEWKVTLKEGITFQNGEKMTGDKVKASLERLIKESERAAADLRIDNITADANTITIKTKEAQPIMANLLTEPYSAIVDTTGKGASDKAPVATGPYTLTSFTSESGAELKAYEQYWGGKPKTSKVKIKYFSDPNAISLALQSKEIDIVYGLPYANLATYRKDKNYTISEVDGARFISYIYNFDKPLMADAKFRQAVDSLIDKDTYSASLFKGSATPAVGAFPKNFSFALQKSIHEFNVNKAKQLLDEAGYKDTNGDGLREKDGQNINLELLSYTRLPEIPLAIQATQQQLKEVGLDSTIKPVEKIAAALKENTYDISPYTMIAAPTGDPYTYFQSSLVSDGVSNMGHYKNPEVDAKTQQLVSEKNSVKRNQLSQEIQEIVDKDYAFNFIGHFKVALVMNKSVTGIESTAADYYHVTNQLTKE